MNTRIIGPENLNMAVAALARGELVAFPTETVYGLGADGLNAEACRLIFAAKGRPADNPLILHVAEPAALASLVAEKIPPVAEKLIEHFWPGPLTVVVPAHPRIPEVVRAGLSTVAVRAPAHPIAQALIRGLGRPIAAPSANRSGRPSPTTADAVLMDMDGRIGWIIDGGPTRVGVESTVVDCTTNPPTLLRPGGVPAEALEAVIGPLSRGTHAGPARSPGMKYRHYAPDTPAIWVKSADPDQTMRLFEDFLPAWGSVAVVALEPILRHLPADPRIIARESLGTDDQSAASRLFSALRAADRRQPDRIVVVWDMMAGLGLAVTNRVEKACTDKVEP